MSLTPYWQDNHGALYVGHVIAQLAQLPARSVQLAVTSPPYWALRSYATAPQVWGGDPDCTHSLIITEHPRTSPLDSDSPKQNSNRGSMLGVLLDDLSAFGAEIPGDAKGGSGPGGKHAYGEVYGRAVPRGAICSLCGAWRGELGSEPTPELFIEHMVQVFRGVWRVLRDDGTLLVNIGDSYAGSGKGPTGHNGIGDQEQRQGFSTSTGARLGSAHGESGHTSGVTPPPGYKAKDMIGVPWMLAFALRADGWYLRGDYIWAKPNPMPESVTDRCTRSHEYIFHFAKSSRYYWDIDAIREAQTTVSNVRDKSEQFAATHGGHGTHQDGAREWNHPAGRNKRSVWTIATQAYPDAHFATFPEEIPRVAVKAATSEKGACGTCGAPWQRILEQKAVGQSWHDHSDDLGKGMSQPMPTKLTGKQFQEQYRPPATLGWEPGCACGATSAVVPCKVLDPFAGSGTTLQVAREAGRYGLGIELNPDYAEMIIKRIQQMVLF